MRQLLLLAILALPTLLTAQGQSGRHFHRSPRAPATAAATPTVEATAGVGHRVEPLRRLRSGRAWSSFHYSRRPLTPATGSTAPSATDASASTAAVRRTPMWGRSLRSRAR
jgi:hypothetical protein